MFKIDHFTPLDFMALKKVLALFAQDLMGNCQKVKIRIAISVKNCLTYMKKFLKRLCFNIFRLDLVKWSLFPKFILIV